MSESDSLPILLFIVSAEEIKDTEDSCACSESSTQSKQHYALVPVDARSVILQELRKLNIIVLEVSSLSDSFKDKILQGTDVEVLKILLAAQPRTGNWKIYTVEETKSTVSRIFTGDNNTLAIIDEAQLRNHSFLWTKDDVASMVFDVAVSVKNCTLLRKLLALGIDINAALTVSQRCDCKGGTLLLTAARLGNHDAMALLLSYGPELNVKNPPGQSPLYVAAKAQQWNVAALLIVAVASANAHNDDLISVLSIASSHNQPEIVMLLLQHSDFDPKDLASVIVEASASGHKEVVEVLCQFGARGDMKNESGNTALHEAAKMIDCELLEILIRNSDDINVLDEGQTPLVIAIVAYLLRGIMCLEPLYLSGVEICLREAAFEVIKLFHVPLWYLNPRDARYHVEPSTEVIKLLLEHGANPDKGAPIISLVKLGQAEIVTLICKFGVRVNIKDESGCTASHAADRDKGTPIIASLVKSGQVETVTLLCKFGARVDIEDESGCTALHAAVFWGNTELLPILMSRVNYLKDVATLSKERTSLANAVNDEHPGSIPEFVKLILKNGPDPKSGAPIISAVKMRNLEAVKRLCAFGARGDVKDESGLTALHVAARLGDLDILKILISNSDDLNVLVKRTIEGSPSYHTPLSEAIENNCAGEVLNSIVKLLLNHGADPNIGAPVVHAVYNRKEEVVRLLCAFGARGDIKDYFGMTALHKAVQGGGSFELLRIVINNSDDLNVVTVDGRTPLWFAVAFGFGGEALTRAKLLLEKGVDVDLGNPLCIAITRMETEVVKLLCIFGARVDLPEDFSMETFLHDHDHELCSTIMCHNFNFFTNFLQWLISKEDLVWYISNKSLSKILEYNFRDVMPAVCLSYKGGIVKGNGVMTDCLLRFLTKIYVFDLKTSQSVPEILQNVLRSFFGGSISPAVEGDLYGRTYSEKYDLQPLIEMCLAEVRALKDVHVGASTWTLHDVLTKNVEQLARLARTDDFQKPLDLELEFPQYGRIVEYQRQRGCQKRQLLDQALTVSGRIFGDLPIEVTEKILEKLSILDLPAFEIACSSL
nr:PREDICTED: ankyrin-1-like [Bemisia tabaci]